MATRSAALPCLYFATFHYTGPSGDGSRRSRSEIVPSLRRTENHLICGRIFWICGLLTSLWNDGYVNIKHLLKPKTTLWRKYFELWKLVFTCGRINRFFRKTDSWKTKISPGNRFFLNLNSWTINSLYFLSKSHLKKKKFSRFRPK